MWKLLDNEKCAVADSTLTEWNLLNIRYAGGENEKGEEHALHLY